MPGEEAGRGRGAASVPGALLRSLRPGVRDCPQCTGRRQWTRWGFRTRGPTPALPPHELSDQARVPPPGFASSLGQRVAAVRGASTQPGPDALGPARCQLPLQGASPAPRGKGPRARGTPADASPCLRLPCPASFVRGTLVLDWTTQPQHPSSGGVGGQPRPKHEDPRGCSPPCRCHRSCSPPFWGLGRPPSAIVSFTVPVVMNRREGSSPAGAPAGRPL